ncbi:MAG TPA: hypothetical protein VKR05_00620, partial [Candidatus Cybelea sp.]|nr:hypothetical protein [Candidatus Cybelea sp.]
MKPWFAIFVACLSFYGCSGAGQAPAFPASSALQARSAMVPPTVRPDRHRSWISPDAASSAQLLFVSDAGTGDVDMFALPGMALKGKITGVGVPVGECSDTHGNVWISNYLNDEMLEYSHAGAPIGKIVLPKVKPWSCAVDPVTGSIAVII